MAPGAPPLQMPVTISVNDVCASTSRLIRSIVPPAFVAPPGAFDTYTAAGCMAVAATNASPQGPAKVSLKGAPTTPLALTSGFIFDVQPDAEMLSSGSIVSALQPFRSADCAMRYGLDPATGCSPMMVVPLP